MTRKALLVAVGDYGTVASKLTAPAYELQLWQRMLSTSPYSFDSITSLVDTTATRVNVLSEIDRLLDGAQPDDQLLFYFAGHGSVAMGRKRDEAEQSLIAYPGTDGLQAAAICETDIADIFDRRQPPAGTDIAFVIEACFAANFGDDKVVVTKARGEAEGTVPLFAPPPLDFRKTVRSLRTFGAFAERGITAYETPIILAASGKTETAYEISEGGQRRCLFSMRLLGWLGRKQDTFENIIRSINPLHPVHRQTASLGGNVSRASEMFPGEENAGAPSDVTRTPLSLDGGTGSKLAAGLSYVDIDLLGIGCFVDARDRNGLWQARVVFPYDNGEYVPPADRHFACMEIPTRDMIEVIGRPEDFRYTRAGVEWARWYLDAHTISIQTGDFSQNFTRVPPFEQHVPRITQLCPEVRPRNPRSECFAGTPFPGLFAAFLDIPSGFAELGPFNDRPVTFARPITGEVTRPAEYAPLSVRVNVPVITTFPEIVLRPYPYDFVEEVRVAVRSGTAILVANAREVDISGDGGGTVPPEQFRLYYKLSSFDPGPNAPLPVVTGVPIDDCTIGDWP
jgi:hypothetical protein